MFYKVNPSSPTHEKLTALFERIKAANAAALEVVRKYDATLYFRPSLNAAGGIFGIFFSERPSNWKQVAPGAYMPKNTVNNFSKIEEMKNLPVVLKSEILEILPNPVPLMIPGIALRGGVFYIEASRLEHEDLTEIDYTQYLQAMKTKNPLP